MKTFFERTSHWVKQPPVSKLLGWLMALVAVSLGASMVLNPALYLNEQSFVVTFAAAQPQFWGLLYILSGLVLAMTVTMNRTKAQIPSLVLATIHCIFAALTINSVASGGLPVNLFLFSALGLVCIITQLSCGSEE